MGKYCEIFGKTFRNAVIEYVLVMEEIDWSISQVAEELETSIERAEKQVMKLKRMRYIKPTRVHKGTQLYILNKKNKSVKIMLRSFNHCLKAVVEEHSK